MRKYLFSAGSGHGHELRRRLSGCSAPSPGPDAASSHRRAADEGPAHSSLPELNSMVENALGPVGHPKDQLTKYMPSDRLVATLNAGVKERERLLLQFLRARQHNAHEAWNMINNALRWRKSINMEAFLTHSTRNMVKTSACFPMHIVSAPDKCKQPVIYGLIRLLDKKKAERVDFQNALLSFLESIYFGDTYVLDEMIIILDFRDWSIRRNAPYRLVKDGIQTLQDYYPERLGRVFLVNYPTSIRAAYTAVSPIIDAGAKEKIVWIADADPSATLRKYVAPKSIPSFLGGELEATFPPTWPDVASEFAATVPRAKAY